MLYSQIRRLKQQPRVIGCRICVNLLNFPLLEYLAVFHDNHPVAHLVHDAQVMRYEKYGETKLPA